MFTYVQQAPMILPPTACFVASLIPASKTNCAAFNTLPVGGYIDIKPLRLVGPGQLGFGGRKCDSEGVSERRNCRCIRFCAGCASNALASAIAPSC